MNVYECNGKNSFMQRRMFIFSFGGGVDKYLGGCCCLLWPGRGGNARKGQGKSLTKFVFGLHGEI
jgi:hypothetical protein